MDKTDRRRRVARPFFGVCFAVTLSACVTADVPPATPPVEPAPVIEAPVTPAPAPLPPAPQPRFQASDFIGQPLGTLEAITGPASFERAEGAGRFLRYDRAECRLFVVVSGAPDGRAVISALSAGNRVAGAPAPSVSDCLGT